MEFLHVLAIVWLIASICCVLAVLVDEFGIGNRLQMWIMDVVWPLTSLWAGPLGLYYYFKLGRLSTKREVQRANARHQKQPAQRKTFLQMVGIAASHCGAGCTLGDLFVEWFVFSVPLSLFGYELPATWLLDCAVAFLLGIGFQYFTIKPMRHLSVKDGLSQAVKADTLSITAWQAGMYGWMAIAIFVIAGHKISKTSPVFWFMMQIAMFVGFATALPANWFLLKKGLKEKT